MWYVDREYRSLAKANVEALRKVLKDHDQRDLEKAIGSPNPGEASGDRGATIQPGPPPGVHK